MLHEDGLADTADGLGAHVTRERQLGIMRTRARGPTGALALVASLSSRGRCCLYRRKPALGAGFRRSG